MFFPSHQSPLILSPWLRFFFPPLCSTAEAVDAGDRLQTETFSGNTLKYQLPGQILGLGIFMLFRVYLGHVSSAPLPPGPVYLHLVPQVPTAVVSHTDCSGWCWDKGGGHFYSSRSAGVPAPAATRCHYTAQKPSSPASAASQTRGGKHFSLRRRARGLLFFSILLKVSSMDT